MESLLFEQVGDIERVLESGKAFGAGSDWVSELLLIPILHHFDVLPCLLQIPQRHYFRPILDLTLRLKRQSLLLTHCTTDSRFEHRFDQLRMRTVLFIETPAGTQFGQAVENEVHADCEAAYCSQPDGSRHAYPVVEHRD